MIFLCEHWLRHGEIDAIIHSDFNDYWCNLKSSIDPTEALIGRPFGGCGFVCKKIPGLVYRPIECTSERIAGVEVIANQTTLMHVYGVYMPTDDKRVMNNECFLDTLHELQSYVDRCESVPCVIVGDLNTRLPQAPVLTQKWYRGAFSKRSALLYDFICDNDLYVANFSFPQRANYTWHNAKQKSYIDHVLVPLCFQSKVLQCRILCDAPDNASDHYAIHTRLKVTIPSKAPEPRATSSIPRLPRLDWDKPDVKYAYHNALMTTLQSIPLTDPNTISSVTAEETVNSLSESLVSAIHQAAQTVNNNIQAAARSGPRRRHWWDENCTLARDRMRLFYHMWKSCGRPGEGAVYECYKDSRRAYRRTLRRAVSTEGNRNHRLLTQLFHTNRPGKFWNLVRKARARNSSCDAIQIAALQAHFDAKFNPPDSPSSDRVQEMEGVVHSKQEAIRNIAMNDVTLSELRTKRLIRRLRKGCSPGIDGVSPEHFSYGIETLLPLHLSILLTICLRFGCFPQSFCVGKLVPILKKPQLDPSAARNYRPITVSVMTSKLLELYILEKCSNFAMHPCQFGFVQHRSTATAISLANDVCSYCCSQGTPVYLCSLDAEGAFDAIPHAVLFHEAIDVLPDHCWRLLYRWYSNMSVIISWNGQTSAPIPVKRGTRQGGLSSPFLFNLFYKSLINRLDNMNCGISINNHHFNTFCYADDVLLTSTTTSGLQSLIDAAVSHITPLGLRFNPTKTRVTSFGSLTLKQIPTWTIEGTPLTYVTTGIEYLGAILRCDKGVSHCDKRTKAAQRAFYGLQSAGLHFGGVEPSVASKLYSVGVRSVMTYGCEAVTLKKSALKSLECTQGKLVKAFLGLRKHSRNTPLLSALKIPTVGDSVCLSAMKLLRSCLMYPSKASHFYSYIIQSSHPCDSLIDRCLNSKNPTLNVSQLITDPNFTSPTKVNSDVPDGLVDSISQLLCEYNDNARNILQMLLNVF